MRGIYLLILIFFPASSASAQNTEHRPGLLIMAHGGTGEWNSAVEKTAESLGNSYPISVAFGMADPKTLEIAVRELELAGASSIVVVRLFISAMSFLPETEYVFQLRSNLPEGHYMNTPTAIDLKSPVILSSDGLLDAAQVGSILADRAKALSKTPENETVLIIGHGPASDQENREWIRKMNRLADSVRASAPFHQVVVQTLREDWTGKREAVELELRKLVQNEHYSGRIALVIPFRLYGFGPYADVLDGLEYRADSTGFLPDARINSWISDQFERLSAEFE